MPEKVNAGATATRNVASIAASWLRVSVEIRSPIPIVQIEYSSAPADSTQALPTKRTSKSQTLATKMTT